MTASPSPVRITIHVDDKSFHVDSATMSGSQIKALVAKDVQYGLFLESRGREPDQAVPDSSSIRLESGMHFYTVPAAVFGR
jgi:hypothetical protein